MRTRAAIYARMSDARGDDTAGVDRQQGGTVSRSAPSGKEVVGVHVDNSKERLLRQAPPAYEQMLAEIRAGNVDVLVAYSSDRIYWRLGDGAPGRSSSARPRSQRSERAADLTARRTAG